MKNFVLALVALFGTTVVNAQVSVDNTFTVGYDYLYRGQSLSADDGFVGLSTTINNLVVDGTFLELSSNTVSLSPVNGNVNTRNEYVVGYRKNLSDRWSVEGSLARVDSSNWYNVNYTEARGKVNFTVADGVSLFSTVGYTVGSDSPNDVYADLGAKWVSPLSIDKLTLVGLVSAVNYDDEFYPLADRDTLFNNAQITATYNVWGSVDAFATFSHGGKTVFGDLDNQASAGVVVRF